MTFTVTVGGNSYEVYGGLTAAQQYIGPRVGDAGTAWNALPSTAAYGTASQSSVLVNATRFVEEQIWQGQPTSPAVGGTTLSWPRTNVVDAYGNPVDSGSVPANLVTGVFELAAILANDPDVFDNFDAGTNIKSVKAGSAGVDYFVPTSASDGSAPMFPSVVQRLIAQYLAAAVDTVGGGIVSGGSDCEDSGSHRWDRSWPF